MSNVGVGDVGMSDVGVSEVGVTERGVAVVTGAAGGIGAAVARRLAADGFVVACLDLDVEGAELVAKGLTGALAVGCDVADEDSVRAAVQTVRDQTGAEPTALVNAAGWFARHDVPELSVQEWRRFMDVNATGPFLLCRELLPAMVTAGRGSIVNVVSTAGVSGGRQRAAYCASKGALLQLTRSLSLDHGPQGVRVNALCPGLIDTPMADWIRHDPDAMAEFDASLPAGRIGTPEEVAGVASFLVGPDASYVHGATIMVDGGISA